MTYFLYKHIAANGRVLYVGCTNNLNRRTDNHKCYSPWFNQVSRLEYRRIYKKEIAVESERLAILFLRPRHNKMGNAWAKYRKLPCEISCKTSKLIATNMALKIVKLSRGKLTMAAIYQ